MANIIIIEDDDRVTREMTQFIREIGEDNTVRSFKTTEQFIKRYTKTESSTNLVKNEYKPSFSYYAKEDLEKISGLTFSESPAFPGLQAKLHVKLPDMNITDVDLSEAGNLFLYEADKVKSSKNFLKEVIPVDYHLQWDACLKKIIESKSDGASSSIIIPVQNGDSQWLIHFKLSKLQGATLEVAAEDLNKSEKGRGALKRELNSRNENQSQELDLFSSINLVLIKNGLIEISTTDWISATRKHLKENGFFPEESVTRFIITKYEDDGIAKNKLFHPYIDDLITLPLDRLLFLQKIDIALTLPKKTEPRFLFLQTVDREIEISKRTRLEGFNDMSIAITNPIALRPGLASTFFFRFPTGDEMIRVTTKSAECEVHPEDPTLFVANFDFFGADRSTVIKIKGYLRKINEYKEILSFNEDDFSFHEENIFLTDEQKRVKTVVVLEADEKNRKQIRNSILENMQQVRVIEESSFYLFEKKYLLSEEEESVPLKEHELFDKKFAWKIDAKTFDFISAITEPEEEDTVCGNLAKDYFSGPKEWKYLFNEGHTQDLLLENLNALQMKGEESFLADLKHSDQSQRLAQVTIRHDINKIEVCIAPPDPDALKGDVLDSVDTIILNSRMLPPDFNEWHKKLNERLTANGLNATGKPIKLISFAEPKDLDEEKFNWLLEQKIESLVMIPIDSKLLCYQLSKALNNSFTRYNPKNVGSYKVNWPAYVAKKAKLIAISEFGCTVQSKRPLRIGTTVFLHGFIYDMAPGQNLCARMYHCEEDPNEPGYFICYFTYFGIGDSFLKYTRNWIRENYANLKSQKS